MCDDLVVHPRVCQRYPDISPEDVHTAWRNAVSVRRRTGDPPDYVLAARADHSGRLLEMLAVELDGGGLLVFHAMRLTGKVARELAMTEERR